MDLDKLDHLYGDAILDHCRNPRNHIKINQPTLSAKAVNPFCGDEANIQIDMENGRISRVGVQGVGCAINQATTSMQSETIKGKTLRAVQVTEGLFRKMMSGSEISTIDLEYLGDLKALITVREYPIRIKGALLGWSAIEEAIGNTGQ